MKDLLFALGGEDGDIVRLHVVRDEGGRPQVAFAVSESLEPSLQEMVERLLPVWCLPSLSSRLSLHFPSTTL